MEEAKPYKVYFHKMKDRKEKQWTASTKLKPGLNIIRTFKDDKYSITIKGPRLADNLASKAVKVDKLAIMEALNDRRPRVALITGSGGYAGTIERLEFEQKGIILKRAIPKIILRGTPRRATIEYTDIKETYVRSSRDIWSSLIKYRKDDYYYEVYLVSVEGEYTFSVFRG